MGGGGNTFGGGYAPGTYKDIIRESYEKTRDAQFETTINDMINEQLAEYNKRDSTTTKERLKEIKEIIQEDDIGTVEMRFGGSVSKHTYVDGISDADVLVVINKSELSDSSPHDVLEYIKTKLNDNLSNVEELRVGNLTTTVKFSDGEEIQLLPAIRRGEGYKIPDQNNDDWSNVIRPDKFAEKLTEVNQNCNRKVIPVIKLVKDINERFSENQKLEGYHMESIAIEAFKSYPDSNPKTLKVMLRHFFEKAKDIIKHPIKDRTNQSIHVDDYLGQEDSMERTKISYTLDRIARKIKNADEIGSVYEWKSILGINE